MVWCLLCTWGKSSFYSNKQENYDSDHHRKFGEIFLLVIRKEEIYEFENTSKISTHLTFIIQEKVV
jgi:hypothetical protein